MIRQVRFDKKTRVVQALAERIERGELGAGERLPGEHELAAEFDVSRGTLREALQELKRRNYIATQTGVGSIVTYDGVPLDQGAGWARALAGVQVRAEVLRLQAASYPALAERFGHARFIELLRRRCAADGSVVSLERSLLPASGGLEQLPACGLLDGSLTATLARHGFIGDHGEQWIGAEPLPAEPAEWLQRQPGTVFLKALRESWDASGRFVEQVESWLDPAHFQLHLHVGTGR